MRRQVENYANEIIREAQGPVRVDRLGPTAPQSQASLAEVPLTVRVGDTGLRFFLPYFDAPRDTGYILE